MLKLAAGTRLFSIDCTPGGRDSNKCPANVPAWFARGICKDYRL